MNSQYDIVIAGGSMVGTTLAAALGDSSLRIAVLEASEPSPPSGEADYDLRVSAITRASERIFRRLDAWQGMEAIRVSPFREMHVWDAGGGGEIHFDSADVGESSLGYIIENRLIQWSLLQRVHDCSNVDVYCPAALDGFEVGKAGVDVALDDGRHLQTRLLVGADGARSQVRSLAGISVQGWDYNQQAVVATVKPARHHEETAWQRFLPTGPLAFLPLLDGYCSIVWSTTPSHAQTLLELDSDAFRLQLEQAFASRLGTIEELGPRASFPLRLQHAGTYLAPRVALIGDAAHTIHPLAGQGVNLGLLDAAVLAQVLLEGHARGYDPGDVVQLRRYERWRKGDNLAMMAVMDGFKRLFGGAPTPVRVLRSAGLSLVNRTDPLKHLIIRRAMGLAGELPDLARSL